MLRYWILPFFIALMGVAEGHSQQTVIFKSDGQQLTAELVSLDAESVEFIVDGQARQLPVDQVFAIRRRGAKPPELPNSNALVGLVDGSTLVATGLQTTETELSLNSGTTDLVIPRRNVEFIQLARHDDPALQARWREILQTSDRASDLLVFQRNGQLDYLEGLVGTIDNETIDFTSNGKVNQAPRDRIDSVIYFQAVARSFTQATGSLATVAGDDIAIQTVQVQGDQLMLTTLCGTELKIPIEQLTSIELGNRRVVYLSKLDPSTSDWQPLVLNREIADHQKTLNRARFDRTFDGKRLQLRFPRKENTGTPAQLVEFSHGIAAKGGTRLVFDLAQEFSKLTGIAGFAPGYSDEGHVEIVISGDGQTLFQQTMQKRHSGPVPLDLDVTGVRRLVIRVDYLDGRNIGDVVHLCDVKVNR